MINLAIINQVCSTNKMVFVPLPVPPVPVTSSIICDIWQSFEFDTITTGALDNSDHGNATWTIYDTSAILFMSQSGEQHTISYPQNIIDTGSYGLGINLTDVSSSYLLAAMPVSTNSASIGIWFYAGALSSTDTVTWPIRILDPSVSGIATIIWRRDAGVYSTQYSVASTAAATLVSNMTPNSWYWATIQYVMNGSVKFALYDLTGSIMSGTTKIATDISGQQAKYIEIGNCLNSIGATTGSMYFDDLVANWTGSVFPLGP